MFVEACISHMLLSSRDHWKMGLESPPMDHSFTFLSLNRWWWWYVYRGEFVFSEGPKKPFYSTDVYSCIFSLTLLWNVVEVINKQYKKMAVFLAPPPPNGSREHGLRGFGGEAVLPIVVWEGFAWSRSRSPPKQGPNDRTSSWLACSWFNVWYLG